MIKKGILLCFLALGLNCISAQENIIKTSALIGNLGVQYERSLSDHFSAIAQVGYSKLEISGLSHVEKSDGLGLYLEGRYYFSNKKDLMEGWHIGPYYNSLTTKLKSNKDLKTTLSSFGLSTGYQWVFNSQVSLEIIFGGGTLNINSDIPGLDIVGDILGNAKFMPHLGFTLGYNF